MFRCTVGGRLLLMISTLLSLTLVSPVAVAKPDCDLNPDAPICGGDPPPPLPPPPLLPPQQPPTLEQIQQFAPEVRLHPIDKYRPSSVEWYLPWTNMIINLGIVPTSVLPFGQVNTTNITQQMYWGYSSGSLEGSPFSLDIPSLYENTGRLGNLDSAVTYAHVLNRNGYYEIQYWFFYPFSGNISPWPLNITHEGDFEHITVRLDQGKIVGIFYSVHDKEGYWVHPTGYLTAEGHPIVYSAYHSHASYPTSGHKDRENIGTDPTSFAPDNTAYGGPTWRTWEKLEVVDQTRPNWMAFSGRWGPLGAIDASSGPYGLLFKNAWNNGDVGYNTSWKHDGAERIIFQEGNDCWQNTVGFLDLSGNARTIDLTEKIGWANDEARSVSLTNVRAGTVITVFNESDGNINKDYAEIIVKQDVPGRCIGSFETSFEDDQIKVDYHRDNGDLDGKVSLIKVR